MIPPPIGAPVLDEKNRFTQFWYVWLSSLAPAKAFSGTIATAKLTGGGANGSLTFTNGVLTASTPAT